MDREAILRAELDALSAKLARAFERRDVMPAEAAHPLFWRGFLMSHWRLMLTPAERKERDA